ncbi:holliday junction resolvase [Arthrobacter phage KeAlii]|uniref:Holliday junction resolvase n=1 Tax=Arthrobacter phage KeAlii TaxID=2885973 RepID=A0AA95B8C0_9CAUD|nr:holliday junction resolvase [Arthrobacter phage KeAlii]UDL14642.1 holliday junction resolvase [Arthrobacter phage KeAlii]
MSAAKAKGTKWETDLVKSLSAFFGGRFGLAPRRVAQEGFNDSGDLHGISPFTGQAKNYKSWEDAIRLGLDGAEKQKHHAGEPFGVAFIKRIRKPVGGGYAVMTVATWARMLVRLRRAEAYLREASPDLYRKHSTESEIDAAGDFPRG